MCATNALQWGHLPPSENKAELTGLGSFRFLFTQYL